MEPREMFEALAASIEDQPSVCGVIEDDVPCTLTPSWRSTAKCCGWTDEACTGHRAKLDALFESEAIDCGTCGRRVGLTWSGL